MWRRPDEYVKLPYGRRRVVEIPPAVNTYGQKELCASKRFVDARPSTPSTERPNQRIIQRHDRPVMRLQLHILGNLKDSTGNEDRSKYLKSALNYPIVNPDIYADFEEHRKNYQKAYEWTSKFRGPDPKYSKHQQLVREKRHLINSRGLTLADFSPLKPPFVPCIVRILVNAIEKSCYEYSWKVVWHMFTTFNREALELLSSLFIIWNDAVALEEVVRPLSPFLLVTALRIFLGALKLRPLHFYKNHLLLILQRPLYDHFLRPNPDVKTVVRSTVLPTSRTNLDTLSFLMLHLLHTWHYSGSLNDAKPALVEVYGPLIVSFAERPTIADHHTFSYMTSEESAIFDVVMEVCDVPFWNQLGMLKVTSAFDHVNTPQDIRAGHCLPSDKDLKQFTERPKDDCEDDWCLMPILITDEEDEVHDVIKPQFEKCEHVKLKINLDAITPPKDKGMLQEVKKLRKTSEILKDIESIRRIKPATKPSKHDNGEGTFVFCRMPKIQDGVYP